MFDVTIHAKCETVDEALHLLKELEDCVGKNNAELEDSDVRDEEGSLDAVSLPSLRRRPPKPNVGDLVVLRDDKVCSYVGTDRPQVISVFDSLDEDWGDDGFMAVAQRDYEEEIGETSAWYAIVGDGEDQAIIGDHEVKRIISMKT